MAPRDCERQRETETSAFACVVYLRQIIRNMRILRLKLISCSTLQYLVLRRSRGKADLKQQGNNRTAPHSKTGGERERQAGDDGEKTSAGGGQRISADPESLHRGTEARCVWEEVEGAEPGDAAGKKKSETQYAKWRE